MRSQGLCCPPLTKVPSWRPHQNWKGRLGICVSALSPNKTVLPEPSPKRLAGRISTQANLSQQKGQPSPAPSAGSQERNGTTGREGEDPMCRALGEGCWGPPQLPPAPEKPERELWGQNLEDAGSLTCLPRMAGGVDPGE